MRTVVEDAQVSEVIDSEQRVYPRLEEAFDALKWWLCRVPESGEIIDDLYWLYKQAGDRQQNIPALVAIYTFDNQYVWIKFILVRISTI